MRVDATGGDNPTFAGDRLGSRPDDYVDVRLHIGIAGFAYGGNTPVLDADIGFDNSPVIENERVGDDRINRALAPGTPRPTPPLAGDLSASPPHPPPPMLHV